MTAKAPQIGLIDQPAGPNQINNMEVVQVPQKRQNSGKGRILIAEDQKICVQAYKDLLENLEINQDVDFCYTGAEILDKAIQIYKERPGDPKPIQLMILDNQMPKKLGMEVI